jgi:hypothetical protein
MGQQVDVWTWPQVAVQPGAQVTLAHSAVLGDRGSAFDPDHWYWMSAVADFDPNVRPDRPVPAAAVEVVSQYGYRPEHQTPGPNDTVWIATWRNRTGDGTVYFRPRVLHAPAS